MRNRPIKLGRCGRMHTHAPHVLFYFCGVFVVFRGAFSFFIVVGGIFYLFMFLLLLFFCVINPVADPGATAVHYWGHFCMYLLQIEVLHIRESTH